MTASSSEPAAIDWIETEVVRHHGKGVELPSAADSNNSLCEFLRDGRALCLLASALADDVNNANKNDQEFALPKKIEKSMHQLSTFHGLERIHYFIRWCRAAAKLEEHLVFTSVQLLDETNADAVLATVDALRVRFRPSFVSTVKPVPAAPSPEDEEEEDNNATENDTETSSVTSSRSSTAPPSSSSSLANKLNAFLTKVPSAPPTIAPTVERQTSLSNSSINSRDSRVASVTSSERADDDDQTSESSSESRNRSSSNSRLSASPRVSKLKLPGAFASLQTVAIPPPPVEEEEPPAVEEELVTVEEEVNSSTPNRDAVDDFDERIKVVSKLEIPMVFGRQRSASSVDESSSVKSEGGESAKALPRSVSKLKIPKAFAGGAGDDAPPPPEEEEPAAPVVEEPISNSPKSKLAAFAKTLAPTPPPAEPVPEETKPKRKSNGKLKIPGVFGKAVGETPAAKAAIAKKKPVTKLSAFLSTVENKVPPPIEAKPEKRFAFPIPGTEEAKKPVKKPEPAKPPVAKAAPKSVKLMAFMTKVVAAPPTMAPRIERDGVPDHPHDDETEKKIEVEPSVETAAVEEEKTTQPLSARGSALAAFMKKVVVAPPAPAPRVERDEPAEPVKEKAEEIVKEKAEEIVTQEPAAATLTVELVEEESSVDPLPKANRLLAFLAKNESPKAPLSEADEEEDNAGGETAHEEEEEAAAADIPTEEGVEEETPESAVVHDDDDEYVRPVVNADPDHDVIVEVSGELTHEAILRRRLSLSSPRAKSKSIAARKLFPDDEEEDEVASVRKSTEAGEAKLQAENESLKEKLVSVEAVVTSQASSIETLQAELKALREQLETQTQQLTAMQQTLADQQIVVTQAQESEEAARYAARQAFTARDEAEEGRRKLQEKLDELTRAA